MERLITNCGLIALRNIDTLKNISVRTLVNIAEDNGVALYPYKVSLEDIENIEFPAILHYDNHFSFCHDKSDILKNPTGIVLLTKKGDHPQLEAEGLKKITGQTWVAAGIASGAATMAGVQYLVGEDERKKDAKNRPKYEIPFEVYQNLTQAQIDALQGLPEDQKQEYIANLQRSASFGLGQLSTRKSGLAGVSSINQQQNKGYQDLLAADSQARMQNKQQLNVMRQNVANYKDQKYNLGLNAYYENVARKQANQGALFQNLNSAAGLATGSMSSGATSPQSQGQMQSYQSSPMMYQKTSPYNTQAYPTSPYQYGPPPASQVSSDPYGGHEFNYEGFKGSSDWY